MSKKLYKRWQIFDGRLIDHCFQPAADWFRDKTGRSIVWIAKWLLRAVFIEIATTVIVVAKQTHETLTSDTWITADIFIAIMIGVCTVILFAPMIYPLFMASTLMDTHQAEMENELADTGTSPGRPLLERARYNVTIDVVLYTYLMIFWFILELPFPIFFVLICTQTLTLFLALYFSSCFPRPRKRQLVEKIALA